MYIRQADLAKLPSPPAFHTKLEMAADLLRWAKPWVEGHFEELWVVVDGGYAKKPFLQAAKEADFVVVSRLRKDAHLCDLPAPQDPSKRGRKPIYGKNRIRLAELAKDKGGWQQVSCVQYGERVSKTCKSFLATWRPAGGVIRVVLVKEEKGWVAFFCLKAQATAVQILEGMADRSALEQSNKDVKEVWGAGQQQVRDLDSNTGCFNLNLWMSTLTEVWAWDKTDQQLVDRSDSPWDHEPRRPSHNDKRKALQKEVLEKEIQEALSGEPTREKLLKLAQRVRELAA
jgi:hypothetical protein